MSKTWIMPFRPIFREHDVLHEGVAVALPDDEAQIYLQNGSATFAEPPVTEPPVQTEITVPAAPKQAKKSGEQTPENPNS